MHVLLVFACETDFQSRNFFSLSVFSIKFGVCDFVLHFFGRSGCRFVPVFFLIYFVVFVAYIIVFYPFFLGQTKSKQYN